ncbi:MAG: hypothetical protein IT243_06055 [Bacteroidia bacterium]|nr:hypothetical protein [Bacteroidia bacterium]
MSNQKKYTIAILVVVILLVIFLLYYFKKKKETCPNGGSIPSDGDCKIPEGLIIPADSNGCNKPYSYINNHFPLELGMKGNLVKSLQTELNKKAIQKISVDGFFGCLTLAEIKKQLNLATIDAEQFNDFVNKKSDKNIEQNELVEL